MDDSTLKLCYDGKEDYGGILDQLQTENVDHIDFTINPSVEKRLIYKSFFLEGSPALTMHMAIHNIPKIFAQKLNIPIIHFEGLMRSYDWRMPEEKYRGIIDHLSDIIYTYYPEYKKQGIDEGINPKTIVVVTNPIVDILQKYYFDYSSLSIIFFFNS